MNQPHFGLKLSERGQKESFTMNACEMEVLKVLKKRPSGVTMEQLNNRIKFHAWQDINDCVFDLLKRGIVAVTNKRIWLKDHWLRKIDP
jgi:hypothetical protein